MYALPTLGMSQFRLACQCTIAMGSCAHFAGQTTQQPRSSEARITLSETLAAWKQQHYLGTCKKCRIWGPISGSQIQKSVFYQDHHVTGVSIKVCETMALSSFLQMGDAKVCLNQISSLGWQLDHKPKALSFTTVCHTKLLLYLCLDRELGKPCPRKRSHECAV